MPRATVSHETERYYLKSLPEGWVDLRTMTFHEMNTRSDIATRMYQEQTTGKKQTKRDEETVRGYFEIMNVAVTEYEFRNCIVAHNLEDENGELIDFTRPMQAWRLDPKIGQEIDRVIDDMNTLDEADDLGPLESPLTLSSSTGVTSPSPPTESES